MNKPKLDDYMPKARGDAMSTTHTMMALFTYCGDLEKYYAEVEDKNKLLRANNKTLSKLLDTHFGISYMWHDLEKNENDLPIIDEYGISPKCIVYTGSYSIATFNGEEWETDTGNYDKDVICAWKYLEEFNGKHKIKKTFLGDLDNTIKCDKGLDVYSYIASKVYDVEYSECLEFNEDGTPNILGKKRRTAAKQMVIDIIYNTDYCKDIMNGYRYKDKLLKLFPNLINMIGVDYK